MAGRPRQQRSVPPGLDEAVRHLERAAFVLAAAPAPVAAEVVADALEQLDAARRALARLGLEETQQRERAAHGDGDGTPAVVRRLVLVPGAGAARAARDFCRKALRDFPEPVPVRNAVLDVMSELVSNAVRNSSADVVVSLEVDTTHVEVRVWDDATAPPRLLPYRLGVSEHGLGLHLVQRLSSDWGYTFDDDGKWVWALVPRSAAPAPSTVAKLR